MLVEPKIKALFNGEIEIEEAHDESIIKIIGKKETKTYYLRRSDIAKDNELAGVSGKVEGKYFLPFKGGQKVVKNDSIVEVIKQNWNVPTRIPYASELKVEDGVPVTQVIKANNSGTVKYFNLEGDYLNHADSVKKRRPYRREGSICGDY